MRYRFDIPAPEINDLQPFRMYLGRKEREKAREKERGE
jgi:hypothetical protein